MPRSLIEVGSVQSNVVTNTVSVSSTTVVPNLTEKTVIHRRSPTGSVEIDFFRGTIHYFVTPASGNFQFDFRFSSTPGGIDTVISAGQSLTVAILVTNGATAYRPSGISLDSNELTRPIKWNGANGGPSEGTANSVDTYVFTFLKKLNGELEILANAKSTGGGNLSGGGSLVGQGGTITSSGGFNTHTFTTVGSSTFEIVEQ